MEVRKQPSRYFRVCYSCIKRLQKRLTNARGGLSVWRSVIYMFVSFEVHLCCPCWSAFLSFFLSLMKHEKTVKNANQGPSWHLELPFQSDETQRYSVCESRKFSRLRSQDENFCDLGLKNCFYWLIKSLINQLTALAGCMGVAGSKLMGL